MNDAAKTASPLALAPGDPSFIPAGAARALRALR